MVKSKKIIYVLMGFSLLFFSGCSISAELETAGEFDVSIQDYTGEAFSFFLTMPLQYTSLTQSASMGDTTIFVSDTTNCLVFDAIDIYDNDRYFQSLILSKTANTITMNSDLDRDFNLTDTTIKCGEWNLATSDGSITPETFLISPPNNENWHIISTIIKITDNSDWDLSKFGGGSALTNGISGRITDGYEKDLFLIYDNSGFSLRGFNVQDFEKAPAGVYGFTGILYFKDIYGAVLPLNGSTNDEWQAINRDDLTNLLEVAITVNGHYTTEGNN